uniref:Uncharacterized protein n=1 Tax=Anguilla anguilla TaxID=7936 RepID=A0A0E9UKU3_ANGAN
MPPTGSFPHESFSAALPSTKSSACNPQRSKYIRTSLTPMSVSLF